MSEKLYKNFCLIAGCTTVILPRFTSKHGGAEIIPEFFFVLEAFRLDVSYQIFFESWIRVYTLRSAIGNYSRGIEEFIKKWQPGGGWFGHGPDDKAPVWLWCKQNRLPFWMGRYFSILKWVVMIALPCVKILDLRSSFSQNKADLNESIFSKNI